MDRFYFKIVGTVIGLNFLNFDEKPSIYVLTPLDRTKRTDLNIYLYEDRHGSVMSRIKKGRLKGHIQRAHSGLYCELFNITKRRTFCFFERGIPLDFLVSHGVNQSFLVFQTVLDTIFLHTASVVVEDKVYLFVAPSGGGKTTICSLARENGLRVLSDEFCVIKRIKNKFYAGMFPCFAPSINIYEEWEVGGVFFLSKSRTNRVSTISAIEAIRRAMPEATRFYHNYVSEGEKVDHRKHVFRFLSLMFENMDFELLEFSPEFTFEIDEGHGLFKTRKLDKKQQG